MQARLLFTHALSPLHAGTGQGVGVIDLPIAREKATGLPFLPGSSVKGTLRDECKDRAKRTRVFGPDNTGGSNDHAGAVQFSDQRLLLMPVRSLAGTFAWATSAYLLRRFVRDAEGIGKTGLPGIVEPASIEQCFIAEGGKLKHAPSAKVILEDLDLTPTEQAEATSWADEIGGYLFPNDADWQTLLRERICILHDDVLDFLLTTATEVTARIKLQEMTKTVARGQLWYEEALPAETVLAGLVAATPVYTEKDASRRQPGHLVKTDEVFSVVEGCMVNPLQFGGSATVGRGLCRLRLSA